MSKVKVPINCRCGRKTSAVISKPTANSKSHGITTCEHCLSQIAYEVKRDNSKDVDERGRYNHNNNAIIVSSAMITISKDLETLIGE